MSGEKGSKQMYPYKSSYVISTYTYMYIQIHLRLKGGNT